MRNKPYTITCATCFSKHKTDASNKLFCSRECYAKAQSSNPKYLGKNQNNWKGGRVFGFAGKYIGIRVGKKYMLEHRFLIEKKLGRKLQSKEHVHHINHDPSDNRIENLILLSESEHHSYHSKLQPKKFKTGVCSQCNSQFKRTPWLFRNSKHYFCSPKCQNLFSNNRRNRYGKYSAYKTSTTSHH